jgi:general secretion pathway protein H
MAPVAAPRDAGFTLIEVLVVVAVLGLAMSLVAARGPMRSRAMDMQAVVEQVAQAARLAHARAIAQNRIARLVLDIPAHSLRIDNGRPMVLPASMTIAMTAVAGESGGGTLAAIRFNPDGSATGGQIELADGPRRALVGVDWLTGRISVVQQQ